MSEQLLTFEKARELAELIKQNLRDLDKNLKYFHAVQGWLPLGYDSFTIWWDNEMRGLPIAAGIRNWAVYAMIDENVEGGRLIPGMTAVMAHATGLAPNTITSMKFKHRARMRVRSTGRKDGDLTTFSMVIPERWRRHLVALSIRKDVSMADIVRPILKEGIQAKYDINLDNPANG